MTSYRYSTDKFFLYREAPFRVLVSGGRGFVEPPRTNRRDADYHVWWFTSRKIATLVANSIRYTEPVLIGDAADYFRRIGRPGGPSISVPRNFTPVAPQPAQKKGINLEDLA